MPQNDGMNLHANVAVPARDRCWLERLCRYVARPPLAQDRLEARRDGTAHILVEGCELLERLAGKPWREPFWANIPQMMRTAITTLSSSARSSIGRQTRRWKLLRRRGPPC